MRPWPVLLLLAAGCVGSPTAERLRDYNNDGVYLFAQGQYQAALETFDFALTLQPGDANLIFNLGQCHDRLGRADLAERYYLDCLQRSARHVDARQAYVGLLYRTGRVEQANKLIDEWIREQPELADTYVLDAWRLRQQNALPQAHARLQQALKLDPQHRRALTELAIVYEQMNMPERARVLYERIIAREPQQYEVIERLEQLKARGIQRPLPE